MRLSENREKTVAQVTSDLGVPDRVLYRWCHEQREQLAHRGIHLLAPFRRRKQDPGSRLSHDLSRWRYRIDRLFGQLVERTSIKHVWAHDLWHLSSWLLRPTLAVCTNITLNRPPLHLANLLS